MRKCKMSAVFALAAFALSAVTACGGGWILDADGGIVLNRPRGVSDHLEMSSRGVDAIVEWSVTSEGAWKRKGQIRFPTLREAKDDTYGSWLVAFGEHDDTSVAVEGRRLSPGKVVRIGIRHALTVEIDHAEEGLLEVRTLFPASTARAMLELVCLSNRSDRSRSVKIPGVGRSETMTGALGKVLYDSFVAGSGERRLAAGATIQYVRCATGRGETDPIYYPDVREELAARRALWDEADENLILETPSPVINAMFRFAKFRTLESIYFTRGGLVHSPGGYGRYLAAIWANDQAEYACPFLPYLGVPIATEAMKNCYRWFAARMNAEFRPIPSSIIAEGRDFWNGAGDRGDQAMMAHGAARAALASGDADFAAEMMPFVAWCLEFGRRKLTADGVIASDSDELEGRLPAGKANLCTSALHYDALLRAADLAEALGREASVSADYRKRATALATAIERYFGACVEGFDAYRYYDGNDRLRSWIAIPLCFGLDRRADGVAAAVFSDRLWDGVGLRSVSGQSGYWDRSTLYAFRGLAFADRSDLVLPHLMAYTRERLLGSHVPYPVEAYPEGSGSHLAAESALYARVFTEGIFGIVPTGLHSFELRPNLPSSWQGASLRRLRAYGTEMDIELKRVGERTCVSVFEGCPARLVLSKALDRGQKVELRR